MRNTQKIWSWIIASVVTVVLVAWLVLSLTIDCKFLKVELAQWLSIFLAFWATFIITFYFANKKQDYEKYIDAYESTIDKMQKILIDDLSSLFLNDNNKEKKKDVKLLTYNREILLYFKKLGNKLDLLKRYMGDLKIKEEITFVEKNLSEYRENISDDLYIATLKEKSSYMKRQIALIDNKLDEIKLKLHN